MGGAHRCGICGSPDPSRGFRLPGLLSSLPVGKRNCLWACADHLEEATARHARACAVNHGDPQANVFDTAPASRAGCATETTAGPAAPDNRIET